MNKIKNSQIFFSFLLLTIITLLLFTGCTENNKIDNSDEYNYYESQEYINLSGYYKMIEILKREGKPFAFNSPESYELTYDWEDNSNFNYRLEMSYDDEEKLLILTYILTSKTNNNFEMTTQILIPQKQSLTYDSFFLVMDGQTRKAFGKFNIYPATYNGYTLLSFEKYFGSISEQVAREFGSANVSLILNEINKKLINFNFSVKDLGFINYE